MAKVVGKDHPVTIRSLGDGAVRAFATALALANSTNGFLLIDEAENGIHHSVQPKFWNMVLQTAQRNNVQVVATTHSWDCVKVLPKLLRDWKRWKEHSSAWRGTRAGCARSSIPSASQAAAKYGIEVR